MPLNDRKLQSKRSSRKRRGNGRHVLMFVLALAFMAGAGYGLFSLLTRLPWFSLQEVRVSGNHSVPDSLLRQAAEPWLGENILAINRGELRARAAKLARIKSLKIHLNPLHAITLQVTERRGEIYLKSAEGDLFPIDADGVVLEQYGSVYTEDLPVAGTYLSNAQLKPGTKLSYASLRRILNTHRLIRRDAPDFLPLISEYYTVDNTVYIVDAKTGTRLIPSAENLAKQFRRYQFVLDNGNVDPSAVIDLRYDDQVVVKAGS